jgi:NAD(P)-dependent dehydrogenase (short-subunit alcohol dehydrogenase family)
VTLPPFGLLIGPARGRDLAAEGLHRTTLPIRRVVGPADIAALAVHLMTNTAVTGATYDIDGGQQLVGG